MPNETRLIDIYQHLSSSGFEVYFPTQKKGECREPYVVVRDAGTSSFLDYTSTQTLYELLCYVPKEQYSKLRPFADSVKAAMKGLWPMIVPMSYETPPFYDDGVKAHMTAVQYRNIRYTPKGGN